MRSARLRGAAVALAAVLVLTAATTAPAGAGERRGGGHRAVRAAMDAAVAAGVPGVLGQVRDERGTWTGSSGVADVDTGRPRTRLDRFRIGSITKTFVAAVVLQLDAEGRLDLDDPVDRWLPGTVRGNGHDGRRVTVRQLLNHTSGVRNYTDDPGFSGKVLGEGFPEHRYDAFAPRTLVRVAMGHEPYFAPGRGWRYSNTNYVLAGMVVEAATGNSYAAEIERRVVRPLGLRSTVLPGTRARMPGPHGRAYALEGAGADARTVDVTELNPSVAGAAGEMVSTADDLSRFLAALMGGVLLPEESMAEMLTTVPTGRGAHDRYGLGVHVRRLSCGVTLWGHDGDINGSRSTAFSTRGGRRTAVFNANALEAPVGDSLVEAEFCGRAPAAGAPGRPAAAGDARGRAAADAMESALEMAHSARW